MLRDPRSPRTRCRRRSSPSGGTRRRFVARAREGEHVDPDARPPPRGRPRAPRGAAPGRAARRRRREPATTTEERVAWLRLRARARPGGAARASRPAARGARARVLRRLHPVRARGPARASRSAQSRAGCSPASRGCASCSREANRGRAHGPSQIHELTRRVRSRRARRRRDARVRGAPAPLRRSAGASSPTFQEAAAVLAYASTPAAPPPALRERILEQARAERAERRPAAAARRWAARRRPRPRPQSRRSRRSGSASGPRRSRSSSTT